MIKEYADINEDFELFLNGEKIKVKHHCKKKFEDQNPQAIEDLKQVIISELKLNKKEGFIPYDNFECSINWNIEKTPAHDWPTYIEQAKKTGLESPIPYKVIPYKNGIGIKKIEFFKPIKNGSL